MASVTNNQGSLLVNTYATPSIANTAGADTDYSLIWSAYCAIAAAATDAVGSKYRFGRVRSSDVIHSLAFAATALTAGSISLGLYLPNTGAVVSANLFATAVSAASAVPVTEERYTNLALTTAGKRVWELLGLSADPVLVYDVVGTSTIVATVAGTLFVRCSLSTG